MIFTDTCDTVVTFPDTCDTVVIFTDTCDTVVIFTDTYDTVVIFIYHIDHHCSIFLSFCYVLNILVCIGCTLMMAGDCRNV